jgi:integrin alpha FG-GAP repeat containing protein 1
VSTITVDGIAPSAGLSWAVPSQHGPLRNPPSVRAGDFDLDGYPDLLAGLQDSKGSPQLALLRNKRGAGFEAAFWRTTASGSYVVVAEPPGSSRAAVPAVGEGAHGAAFFDVDERGNLDVLLLAGTPREPELKMLRNAFSSDEYFLKVLTLDGECLHMCRGSERDASLPPPYGVNQPGVSYMFSSKSATGSRRLFAGAQLGVSAHSPLLTPYTLFGLGRTNDYVNDFWVGLPSPHRRRFDSGIIPNSQLIAIPHPPDRPSRWTVELYISKADMLPWVSLALTAGLTAIGLVRATLLLATAARAPIHRCFRHRPTAISPRASTALLPRSLCAHRPPSCSSGASGERTRARRRRWRHRSRSETGATAHRGVRREGRARTEGRDFTASTHVSVTQEEIRNGG